MSISDLAAGEAPIDFHGRIVRAEVIRAEVRLRRPLRGPGGLVPARKVRVLRLGDDDGNEGLGEASRVTWLSPQRCAGAEPLQGIAERIAAERPNAQKLAARSFANDSAACCAVMTALLDLEARRRGRSVAQVLAGDDCAAPATAIAVSALVGESDPEAAADEASQLAARGFTSFKIKIAAHTPDDDARRIAAVRAVVGPGASIRLDANRAWTVEDGVRALGRFAGLDADFVEEPLQDAARVAELGDRRRIALDESIATIVDLERAIERGGFRVLVLKLERVGGPLAAIAMADVAARAGLDVVFTDSIESAVGRAAALHTAAAAAARCGKAAHAVGLGGLFLLDDGNHPCAMADIRGPGLGVCIG